VPCADVAPGQDTAASNATAAKHGFDMPNLPRSFVINATDCGFQRSRPSFGIES
jgi:hypothetical protein